MRYLRKMAMSEAERKKLAAAFKKNESRFAEADRIALPAMLEVLQQVNPSQVKASKNLSK